MGTTASERRRRLKRNQLLSVTVKRYPDDGYYEDGLEIEVEILTNVQECAIRIYDSFLEQLVEAIPKGWNFQVRVIWQEDDHYVGRVFIPFLLHNPDAIATINEVIDNMRRQ